MAEPFTIYKLTILNMLDLVDFPLSNTQISNFFLEQEYTDYFRVQQVLNDLVDTGLITSEPLHGNTHYNITDAGRETLSFFRPKLTDAIEEDTKAYFTKHQLEMRNINSILADYRKTPHEDYTVRCRFKERGRNLVDLKLTVRQREQAEAICENWKKQSGEVYACLMDMLLK